MIGVKSKWTRTAFLDKHSTHRAIEGEENDFVFYSLGVNDDCKERLSSTGASFFLVKYFIVYFRARS